MVGGGNGHSIAKNVSMNMHAKRWSDGITTSVLFVKLHFLVAPRLNTFAQRSNTHWLLSFGATSS
jgi:hypothetical protein